MFKYSILLLGSVAAHKISSQYRPIEGTNPWHKDNDAILKDQAELPYPVDYFVPDFGPDEDIGRVQRLLAANGGSKWKFVPKDERPKPHPVDYVVPNFGVDEDVIGT